MSAPFRSLCSVSAEGDEPIVAEEEYVHPAVQRFADQLAEDTGHRMVIERVTSREWRVVADNGRVRMTIDYRMAGRGRVIHAGSTLAIDGQRRGLAKDYDDFIRIFGDPDNADTPPPRDLTDPSDIGAIVQVADCPEVIRRMAQMAGEKMPGEPTIRVGRTLDRWILAIDGEKFQLRLNYRGGRLDTGRPHKATPVVPVRRDHIQLWVGGEDYTEQVGGRFEKVLELLMGTPRADNQTGPAIKGERRAAVPTTGVTVRNTVVMRN